MTEQTCKSTEELLVAYSDGELPAADIASVEAHLAECPDCRKELRVLERSLEVAQSIWHESAASASVPRIGPTLRSRRQFRMAVSAATCATLLVATAAYVLWPRGNPAAVGVADTKIPTPVAASHVNNPVLEDADIEALIARQERVARLQVSARLLATQPGLEKFRDQAERYLADTYGVTALVAPVKPSTVRP
jgi:anti-sigma factor RsiW